MKETKTKRFIRAVHKARYEGNQVETVHKAVHKAHYEGNQVETVHKSGSYSLF
ncbi:hypothetical protein [Neobacillus sp. NPDC093127]|uniref:hypothetical protein n=1 Tax=Neobacillus sp. NPDC093127 TaxID=3364296 RepID=UPI00382901DC